MSDMQVEARYLKRRQEGQFEPAEAEVKTVFTIGEGVDFDAAIDDALDRVKRAVHKVLGLHSEVQTRAETRPDAKAPEPETSKRGPGRPRKETVIAAKEAADKALQNADPMAEVMGEMKGESPTTEEADPMADVVGQPSQPIAEKPVEGKKFTDMELQNEAGKAVQRTGNSKKVREVVAKYAKSIGEIPADKRQEFVDELKALKGGANA
jgi:flagellum-specific peptidoglycan hydrolase FlgJ